MGAELQFIRYMRSGLFTGRLSVGYFQLTEKTCVLMDSGLEEAGAKQLDKVLKANGVKPVAIFNSHFHADHCGGNAYFQKQYPGIRTIATKLEKPFIEHPELEPRQFAQGAEPFAELRNKHLECKGSVITDEIKEYKEQTFTLDGETFTLMPLSGHTPEMMGVITPDKILYVGDALFGEETLEKHGVLFYTNIDKTVASLEAMKGLDIRGAVLYHGGAVDSKEALVSLIDRHIAKLNATHDTLRSYVAGQKSCTLDDVTTFAMNEFGMPNNVVQHTLTQTCVRAYLFKMQQDKDVTLSVDNGTLHINATPGALNRAPKKSA